jgi:hypothetical protein
LDSSFLVDAMKKDLDRLDGLDKLEELGSWVGMLF